MWRYTLLLLLIASLLFEACKKNTPEKQEGRCIVLGNDVKLNNVRIFNALEESIWFIYLMNLHENSKVGTSREREKEYLTDEVNLYACEPSLFHLTAKEDTLCFYFNLMFNDQIIIPKQAPVLEVVYFKNEIIAYGISDHHILLNQEDRAKLISHELKTIDFLKSQKHAISQWLAKSDFLKNRRLFGESPDSR